VDLKGVNAVGMQRMLEGEDEDLVLDDAVEIDK